MRGDKKVNYGAVMRVMGRLSAAGFLGSRSLQGRAGLLRDGSRADEDAASSYLRSDTRRCCCGAWCHSRQGPMGRAAGVARRSTSSRQPNSRRSGWFQKRPRAEKAKPLAEKVAEPTLPPEDPAVKVSEKRGGHDRHRRSRRRLQPKQEARPRRRRREEQKLSRSKKPSRSPLKPLKKEEPKKPPEKKAEKQSRQPRDEAR